MGRTAVKPPNLCPIRNCAVRVPWLSAVEVGSLSFSEEELVCLYNLLNWLSIAAVWQRCEVLQRLLVLFWKKRADVKAKRQRCAGGKKEWPLGVILPGFWRVMEKSIVVEISRKKVGGWFACLSPWSMDPSIAGLVQNSFCKFEMVLLQPLLLSEELNYSVTSQVGFGNCSVSFWGQSSASASQEKDTCFWMESGDRTA